MRLPVRTYVAGPSAVHACDARVKVALLPIYSVALFFIDTWWGMALFACGLAAAVAAARLPVGMLCALAAPVGALGLFAAVYQVATAESVAVGLSFGLLVAIRMLLLAVSSLVVCLTTTSTELTGAFACLFAPLAALSVPVDDIALTLSLAVRFIPLTAEELTRVHDAQLSRGAPFATGGLLACLRTWGTVFIPLFVGLFRRADALATSMEARCYGAASRTSLKEDSLRVSEGCLFAGIALACGAVAWLL